MVRCSPLAISRRTDRGCALRAGAYCAQRVRGAGAVSYTHLDVYKRQIWHRGNPPEQRERLLTIAARHDLLVTGGSDWHGKGKPNGLGENLTDDDTVREILCRGVDLIGRVGSSHAA